MKDYRLELFLDHCLSWKLQKRDQVGDVDSDSPIRVTESPKFGNTPACRQLRSGRLIIRELTNKLFKKRPVLNLMMRSTKQRSTSV